MATNSLARTPERLAWVTLVGAFSVFMTILIISLLFGRWFLFDSSVNLQTEVKVGRGTIGVRTQEVGGEEAVRLLRALNAREFIATDEVAQGYIEFVDSSEQNRVIANALILSGSQVRLISATRPRFRFSAADYAIGLGNFQGRLELEIPEGLPDAIRLSIGGRYGEVVIRESGYYLLWGMPSGMVVTVERGSALFTPHNSDTLLIDAGNTAEYNANNQTLDLRGARVQLVRNPQFQAFDHPSTPSDWGCYSTAELPNTPRGTRTYQTLEGRRALWFERSGSEVGPSETGCFQLIGSRGQGLDVSNYRTLRLRTTVNIKWHSLSICGTVASECALMVELSYINEDGNPDRWIHGFYAYEHVANNLPRSCDSCLIEHDRITPGNWYIYESNNLLELPEGRRPMHLEQIRFYASGHEYETLVGEMGLVGE